MCPLLRHPNTLDLPQACLVQREGKIYHLPPCGMRFAHAELRRSYWGETPSRVTEVCEMGHFAQSGPGSGWRMRRREKFEDEDDVELDFERPRRWRRP